MQCRVSFVKTRMCQLRVLYSMSLNFAVNVLVFQPSTLCTFEIGALKFNFVHTDSLLLY